MSTPVEDLVTVTAGLKPGRIVVTQKDLTKPVRIRLDHPGAQDLFPIAYHQGTAATGDLGWYLSALTGRESLTLDIGTDARYDLQVKVAGERAAQWQSVEWQELAGATQITGAPGIVTVF